MNGARLVAFATHGLLPSDLVCEAEPALALTPGPGNAPADDGLLKASDITALHLDAALVILSACNTAGADGRLSGESLSGLVRAFFFAGGRNVLATHWEIPSKPTVELTTGTIQAAARNGGDWAGGLREAQLKLLQNPATAHPLFWGAFVLVGAG
jgi:CHAT domain-containing protein